MATDRIWNNEELKKEQLLSSTVPFAVVDTNAFLMPFQFGINLDLEVLRVAGDCEIVLLEPVMRELDGLAIGGNKYARMAVKLVANYSLVRARGRGDGAIIDFCSHYNSFVVTNDSELRRKLRARKIGCVLMYGKSYLDWEFRGDHDIVWTQIPSRK